MIINSSIIESTYRCGKAIMRYLVETEGLPVLSYDDKYYYFANTERLKNSLKSMPLHLKLLYGISKKEGGNKCDK